MLRPPPSQAIVHGWNFVIYAIKPRTYIFLLHIKLPKRRWEDFKVQFRNVKIFNTIGCDKPMKKYQKLLVIFFRFVVIRIQMPKRDYVNMQIIKEDLHT